MFFGGNNVETWVKHKGHAWFRCPMCGVQHKPWATDDVTDVKAKRVLTLTCPMTGNLLHIPCENPASQDDRWINNGLAVAPRDLLIPEGAAEQTLAVLDKKGVKVEVLPFDKVHLNGCGLHCSTTPLYRDPV